MERLRRTLPWSTALLPVVAGSVSFGHGVLAGVLALALPLALDLVFFIQGEVGYTAASSRPEPVGRMYSVLFHVYAFGFIGSFSRFALTSHSLSAADIVGRMFSWVVLFGVPTLVVGHALIHGSSRVGRLLGQVLFLLMNYPHFPMIHIETHHRHVATEEDLHSSPINRTFYAFFARCFLGEVALTLQRKHRARMAMLTLAQGALLAAVLLVGGPKGLLVFLATTFLARTVVGLVNYIQHYGLSRSAREKPGVAHAWDLPHKSASLLYFNAGFHADHHMKASVEPGGLAFKSTHYVLPYNIPIILPMALVPWLFFAVMNPRLAQPATAQRSAPGALTLRIRA